MKDKSVEISAVHLFTMSMKYSDIICVAIEVEDKWSTIIVETVPKMEQTISHIVETVGLRKALEVK